MSETLKVYEALRAAAEKLAKQAETDPTMAERLVADPEKTIAEAAGQSVPKGLRIKAKRSADGKSFTIVPEIDQQFSGELDDKVLETVSGGFGPIVNAPIILDRGRRSRRS